jgi:hypothetical protein
MAVQPELLTSYARKIEGLVLALGPRSQGRLLLVLRALGLAADEALAVIEHARTCGLLEADPAAPEILRATHPLEAAG